MIKLHILGSKGAFPPAGDGTSAYLIENDGAFILLDCGSGAITGLQGFCRIEELTGIVVSHLHFDHCAELPLIGYALKNMGIKKDVYMPDFPADMFSVMRADVFDVRDPKQGFCCGGMEFKALRTVHPCPGYSYSLAADGKKFVYTGDTAVHDGLAEFCAGADLILADANLTEDGRVPVMAHMTAKETALLAAEAGAKQLVLTHTPPIGSTEGILSEAAAIFPNVSVASRGKSYII